MTVGNILLDKAVGLVGKLAHETGLRELEVGPSVLIRDVPLVTPRSCLSNLGRE
jgi:hypothetical protein